MVETSQPTTTTASLLFDLEDLLDWRYFRASWSYKQKGWHARLDQLTVYTGDKEILEEVRPPAMSKARPFKR